MPGMRAVSNDPFELLLNNTWRPTLSVTGAEGLPPFRSAGNVLRPYTSLKLSFRLTPTTATRRRRGRAVKSALEQRSTVRRDGEFRRRVRDGRLERADVRTVARAVDAARLAGTSSARTRCTWARAAASRSWACSASDFPSTQFLVTGVLGPNSNAHGPNEFLHIETARKLTACVAQVLADHARQASQRRAA